MNSQLKIYEKLIAECNKEIEINGLRSPNYEFWLKGKRSSFMRILLLIQKGYDKNIFKIVITEIIEQLESIDIVRQDVFSSYIKGKIEGFKSCIEHLN